MLYRAFRYQSLHIYKLIIDWIIIDNNSVRNKGRL